MKMIRHIYNLTDIGINDNGNFQIPNQCPYCGTVIDPVKITWMRKEFNGANLIVIIFKGTCCDKMFFTTHLYQPGHDPQFLSIYPAEKPSILPPPIAKLSPRFASLYSQCQLAESQNFFELAGTGYRNALEVLIKDYAINELSETEDSLRKISLNEAIGKFLPTIDLKKCADVVRILGNDWTHYKRDYTGIDFQVLKQYLEIFILQINAYLLMRHPPVEAKNPRL